VQRPDGVVAFDRSLSGEGSSFCLLGECAFRNATREAMTELLDKVVEMVASEPFRNAMGIEPARSVGATNP